MNLPSLPIALILVGGLVLAGSGWLWTDIQECRNTQQVMVTEGFTGQDYDVEQFERLSDSQQKVFLRAVDNLGSYVKANRDVRLSGGVEYRDTTYEVRSFHVDDCGIPFGYLLVGGGVVLGVGALGAGVSLGRQD